MAVVMVGAITVVVVTITDGPEGAATTMVGGTITTGGDLNLPNKEADLVGGLFHLTRYPRPQPRPDPQEFSLSS
jgi:hypothetical protein